MTTPGAARAAAGAGTGAAGGREEVAVALWGGTEAAGALLATAAEVGVAVGTVALVQSTRKNRYARVTCTRMTLASSAAAFRHYATTW